MAMNELKRNASGYYDPTAYEAIKNILKEGEKMEVYKGDIFYCDDYQHTVNSKDKRPAVIVSNNSGNHFSKYVEVVYLTTRDKKPLPTHCEIIANVPSTALCENIYTIPKTALGDWIRVCTDAEMKRIDEALMISLGIECAEGVPTDDEAKDAEIKQLKQILEEKDEIINGLNKAENEEQGEAIINMPMTAEKVMELFEVTTERNLYKKLYEDLLEKMMN